MSSVPLGLVLRRLCSSDGWVKPGWAPQKWPHSFVRSFTPPIPIQFYECESKVQISELPVSDRLHLTQRGSRRSLPNLGSSASGIVTTTQRLR